MEDLRFTPSVEVIRGNPINLVLPHAIRANLFNRSKSRSIENGSATNAIKEITYSKSLKYFTGCMGEDCEDGEQKHIHSCEHIKSKILSKMAKGHF